MRLDTVNIHEIKPGDKLVYFFERNGYEHDKNHCDEYLVLYESYEVNSVDIGDFSTSIYFKGIFCKNAPSRLMYFNSVMFCTEKDYLDWKKEIENEQSSGTVQTN